MHACVDFPSDSRIAARSVSRLCGIFRALSRIISVIVAERLIRGLELAAISSTAAMSAAGRVTLIFLVAPSGWYTATVACFLLFMSLWYHRVGSATAPKGFL